MSKLYGLPPSPFVQIVLALIAEFGWDVTLTPLDFKAGAHKKPEFLALNPRGQMPALEEEGSSLGESTAIQRYLLATRESPDTFFPSDPKGRAVQDVYAGFEQGSFRKVATELY